MNPIIRAVAEENIGELNRLVSRLVNVSSDVTDHGLGVYRGQTPLTIAVNKLNPELVTRLIQLGADVNLPDHLGFTPLHHVTQNVHAVPIPDKDKQIETLKALLAAPGIDVYKKRTMEDNFTPFQYALYEDDVRFVETFIDTAGIDIHTVKSSRGLNPLELILKQLEENADNNEDDVHNLDASEIEKKKDLARFFIRRGLFPRPKYVPLLRYITGDVAGTRSLVGTLRNAAFQRRKNALMAWQAARNAGEDNNNLPNNQSGGRRRVLRTVRKRKASKKTRRHKHRK